MKTKRMLGIDFFMGTPAEAIAYISKHGGLVIAPAAPSFIALQDDPDWGPAIADADLAIADSGWAVLFWRVIKREKLTRISGLVLFKTLLETPDARIPKSLFFVLPSEKAKARTLEFARNSGYPVSSDDCYVAPNYQRSQRDQRSNAGGQKAAQVGSANDPTPAHLTSASSISNLPDVGRGIADPYLVSILEQRKPKHIIIGIGGGMQDKLGSYLKRSLNYRPPIYCIGAAPGFVTGDQGPHSNVGRPILCRLDFSPCVTTADIFRSLRESVAASGINCQIRTAVADAARKVGI